MLGARIGMVSGKPRLSFILVACFILPLFSGCTGGPPEPTARLTADRNEINVGESVNFDARESTSPDGTLITGYSWKFGDGNSAETIQGYTSHVFTTAGLYEIRVTATNDQGGEDSASIPLIVNGFPEISLNVPTAVRTGDVIALDTSGSSDPEGGELTTIWNFDWTESEEDFVGSIYSFSADTSGNYTGTVTVTDVKGASASESWSIAVLPRTYQVIWEEHIIQYEWDGYLEQNQIHTITHMPGTEGRLMSVNGTLTLAMDLLPMMLPQDNFSLTVIVADDGWENTVRTEQDNITQNSSASIERENMNPDSEDVFNFTADSLDELMQMILNGTDTRFGQGEWQWVIEAEDADPDLPVGEVDPDGGNDWELVVEFTVLVPRVSEVGV